MKLEEFCDLVMSDPTAEDHGAKASIYVFDNEGEFFDFTKGESDPAFTVCSQYKLHHYAKPEFCEAEVLDIMAIGQNELCVLIKDPY